MSQLDHLSESLWLMLTSTPLYADAENCVTQVMSHRNSGRAKFSQKSASLSSHRPRRMGPFIKDVRTKGGWPKGRLSNRGCVDLILEIRPKCGQGEGGGPKSQKLCRRPLWMVPISYLSVADGRTRKGRHAKSTEGFVNAPRGESSRERPRFHIHARLALHDCRILFCCV